MSMWSRLIMYILHFSLLIFNHMYVCQSTSASSSGGDIVDHLRLHEVFAEQTRHFLIKNYQNFRY